MHIPTDCKSFEKIFFITYVTYLQHFEKTYFIIPDIKPRYKTRFLTYIFCCCLPHNLEKTFKLCYINEHCHRKVCEFLAIQVTSFNMKSTGLLVFILNLKSSINTVLQRLNPTNCKFGKKILGPLLPKLLSGQTCYYTTPTVDVFPFVLLSSCKCYVALVLQ